MLLTHEQEACRDMAAELKKGEIASIVAFAGAGKTTTLIEIIKAMDKQKKGTVGVYCAFTRDVARSAQLKLQGTHCVSSTMHSIAMQALREVNNSPDKKPYTMTVDEIRSVAARKVLGDNWKTPVQGWSESRILIAAMKTVDKYCASVDEAILPSHARAALVDMIGDPDTLVSAELVAKAQYTIRKLSDKLVDLATEYVTHLMMNDYYTFDLAMKVLEDRSDVRKDAFGGVDYLVVDEAQDLDEVQISLVKKLGLKTIVVGDPYQSIYGWRGAKNALDTFGGKKFYLTQSFRFGERIAEVGRQILSARPDGGPDKRLIGAGDDLGRSVPRRAVICRTNAGMFVEAQKMIRRGLSFYIEKSETVLADLKSASALRVGDKYNVRGRLSSFDNWNQMVEESEAGDGSLARLVDVIENNAVEDMIRTIGAAVPNERQAQVKITTAHKAKGAEYAEVRLGDDWKNIYELKDRYEAARGKSQAQMDAAMEEFNVLYVAATRAESILYAHERILENPNPDLRVNDPDFGKEEPADSPELTPAGM